MKNKKKKIIIFNVKYNFVRSIILSIISSDNREILLIFNHACLLIIFYAELSDCNAKFARDGILPSVRSVLKWNISSLSIPSSHEKNIRRTNEIPKVCSMRGTSLAHVIREIKGKHFIVNVSREFNSPESF